MKVHEGLVFNRDGSLVGFVDVGDLNNKMRAFEASLAGSEKQEIMADHVLTVMVRGIFINMTFPIANFPTKGLCYYACNIYHCLCIM
jgi:hypothetical protein